MVGLAISIFVCIWVAIYLEFKNAPEIDDNGNIIKNKKDDKLHN